MERRRARRHLIEWSARYRLRSSAQWRECNVIDIAETGIVIEPFGLLEDEALSGDVEIQFGVPADIAEVFELLGAIRHVTRTPEGRLHLEIAFRSLTMLDVMLLDLISRDLDSFA